MNKLESMYWGQRSQSLQDNNPTGRRMVGRPRKRRKYSLHVINWKAINLSRNREGEEEDDEKEGDYTL